jgi:hypothetical protein
MGVSAAVMGLVAHKALAGNTAPFVPVFEAMSRLGGTASRSAKANHLEFVADIGDSGLQAAVE